MRAHRDGIVCNAADADRRQQRFAIEHLCKRRARANGSGAHQPDPRTDATIPELQARYRLVRDGNALVTEAHEAIEYALAIVYGDAGSGICDDDARMCFVAL